MKVSAAVRWRPRTERGSAGKRRLRSRPGEPCARKRARTGSEEGGWKRTRKGNALAAYPTHQPQSESLTNKE